MALIIAALQARLGIEAGRRTEKDMAEVARAAGPPPAAATAGRAIKALTRARRVQSQGEPS